MIRKADDDACSSWDFNPLLERIAEKLDSDPPPLDDDDDDDAAREASRPSIPPPSRTPPLGLVLGPLLVGLFLVTLPACAELASLLGVAAPVAAQAAGSALAAAVASARAAGQLPADPAVEALEARLAALEAAERADRGCPAADAGAPVLDARTVAELLDREAAARVAAAEERRAIAGELRALLARPVASALPAAPAVLPMVDAGAVDASAEGGER